MFGSFELILDIPYKVFVSWTRKICVPLYLAVISKESLYSVSLPSSRSYSPNALALFMEPLCIIFLNSSSPRVLPTTLWLLYSPSNISTFLSITFTRWERHIPNNIRTFKNWKIITSFYLIALFIKLNTT